MESEKPSIEDMAAQDFQTLLPMFKTSLSELTGSKIRRVVEYLFEYPFNEKEFRFSYPEESRVFNIGAKLLDCKHVMMKAAFEMSKEERQQLLKENGNERSSEEAVGSGSDDLQESVGDGSVREDEGGHRPEEGADPQRAKSS